MAPKTGALRLTTHVFKTPESMFLIIDTIRRRVDLNASMNSITIVNIEIVECNVSRVFCYVFIAHAHKRTTLTISRNSYTAIRSCENGFS